MNESTRSKVTNHSKTFRAGKWLILVIYPKENQGHAIIIKFIISNKMIEFVKELESTVRECPLQKLPCLDFDFNDV